MAKKSNNGKVGDMNRGKLLYTMKKCGSNGDPGSIYYHSLVARLKALNKR